MLTLRNEFERAVSAALVAVVGPEGAALDPLIRPAQDPRFGDYQSNVALGLAKSLGKPPREVAAQIVEALPLEGVAEADVAGPGFINFRFIPAFLAARLEGLQADPRLGIPTANPPQRVVVDFSSPNVAKEMHVGHLRSTIIGDTLARLLEFLGHDVLRLNHIGDWGTQFGMLIQHLRESGAADADSGILLHDLEQFYVGAKRRFDEDPEFADRARAAVVELQAGDSEARKLWTALCRESMRHAHEIYDRLGVTLTDRGESFYNPFLPEVVADLQGRGLAVEDQGALCLFLDGFTGRDGRPQPMIIRKSGGGFNYDTTDLAAVRHRVGAERADRIIYVTDKRQADHFAMVFAACRLAGYAPARVGLEHVGFGMVLGGDRRPYKTRDGGTVKLSELLDTAVERARDHARETGDRRADLSDVDLRAIAECIGVGAVKYADLAHNVTSDYVFDWDTMLALEGNTAPYMLYAYARIRSIARNAGVDLDLIPTNTPITLDHPSEVALGRQLLEFAGAIRGVAAELRPHLLTDYLYGLSRAFSAFYDRERGVRIVDAHPEELRASRLRLCDLTARTLRTGLNILGINVVERM